MLKDYYYTDKEELIALRKENEELMAKIAELEKEVKTYERSKSNENNRSVRKNG